MSVAHTLKEPIDQCLQELKASCMITVHQHESAYAFMSDMHPIISHLVEFEDTQRKCIVEKMCTDDYGVIAPSKQKCCLVDL